MSQTSELERVGRDAGLYFTAADLMDQHFEDPKWAVPGLVPEGLSLLVGSPKLGKSWLCLSLGIAVASGGKALGKIDVQPGPVLYAALEDTARRLQNRLGKLLGRDEPPDDLHLITGLPRMPHAIELIDGWLADHPDARLVVVDVLRKIRPPADRNAGAYEHDYDVMSTLKDLADKYSVAIVCVHHTRKQVDEGDVFNEVSGSTGLTGAADAILIAKRARNTSEAVLHVTGRDITEQDFGLSWDAPSCTWALLDEPAIIATMGGTRRRILDYITGNEGATPQEVAETLKIQPNTARQTMRRMVDDDQLGTDGDGRYFVPMSLSPLSLCHSGSDSGDSSDTPSVGGVL